MRLGYSVLAALLLGVGCGGGDDGGEDSGAQPCEPGSVSLCSCGESTRTQACRADGSGYEPCPCGAGGSAGGSTSGGAGGTSGGAGGSSGALAGATSTGGAGTGATASGGSPSGGVPSSSGGGGSTTPAPPTVREYCTFECQMTVQRSCPSVSATCEQDCVAARTSEFERRAPCAAELEAWYRCVMTLSVDAFYCSAGVAAPNGDTHCTSERAAFQACVDEKL